MYTWLQSLSTKKPHINHTFLEEQRFSDSKAKADSILMKVDIQDWEKVFPHKRMVSAYNYIC